MGERIDTLFDPSDVTWTRVSPQLVKVRLLTWTLTMLIPVVAAIVALVLWTAWWTALILAVLVGVFVWVALVIRRQVPAMGYAEREEDLLIRSGILFRSLTVVPYGRMQLVDVEAGPFDRKFGIAKVTLHTASMATSADVPGLEPDEAARLRDRLASRGESRLAGL